MSELPAAWIATEDWTTDGDLVVARGCDVSPLRRGLVLLEHDLERPVGVVERVEVHPDRGVWASWRWASTPHAPAARERWERGELRCSIGYRALRERPVLGRGRIVERSVIHEITLTTRPANRRAVPTARGGPEATAEAAVSAVIAERLAAQVAAELGEDADALTADELAELAVRVAGLGPEESDGWGLEGDEPLEVIDDDGTIFEIVP